MPKTVVTPSPGFISIAVQDAQRSAGFYERYLGATRDTFDFGPDSAVFVGWPTFALSLRAASGPSAAVARDDEHPALVAGQRRPGALRPGGGRWRPGPRRAIRRAVRADLRDGGSRWLSDHGVREGPAAVLAAAARLTPWRPRWGSTSPCGSSTTGLRSSLLVRGRGRGSAISPGRAAPRRLVLASVSARRVDPESLGRR